MTKPNGKASVHPLALPDDWDSPDSLYGFQCDAWLDHPMKNGHDWFSTEERARREANAYAYRQKGTKENWSRYLSLGFFVFEEDCFECDKLWADMEKDPLQVHRSIWYNFRFHIDQMMDIPPKLNAWAINVTRAYLSHFDPSTLYETDTLAYSWKTMPFMETSMEVDSPTDWIPVTNRRRSKSPPASVPPEVISPTADAGEVVPRTSSPGEAVTPLTSTMTSTQRSEKSRVSASSTRSSNRQISWSHRLPSVTTVRENEEKDEEQDGNGSEQPALDNSNPNNTSQGSSTGQFTTRPYEKVATNDGTHRVTVRWRPPEPPNMYERDKKKLNDGLRELVCTMLPPEVGLLYRWESEDLLLSNSAQQMTASELRDFISPAITFLPAQHQIVFGLRIGFATTPGQWTRSAAMQMLFTAKQVDIIISNSTSTSGKMVTAGYVLFKAPNTTQISRYTQFLRSVLPDTAPYFDVVRFKKTPMDQLIPHLRIQRGEKHVTPLCQALLCHDRPWERHVPSSLCLGCHD
ncbi:hypothetical protein MHU86_2308 [Fragilaria crotonensis]|nr:hypothetical protein MHU86_2308 [Fragilaria crotonensis]